MQRQQLLRVAHSGCRKWRDPADSAKASGHDHPAEDTAAEQRSEQRGVGRGARDDSADSQSELGPETHTVDPTPELVEPPLVDLAARTWRARRTQVQRE